MRDYLKIAGALWILSFPLSTSAAEPKVPDGVVIDFRYVTLNSEWAMKRVPFALYVTFPSQTAMGFNAVRLAQGAVTVAGPIYLDRQLFLSSLNQTKMISKEGIETCFDFHFAVRGPDERKSACGLINPNVTGETFLKLENKEGLLGRISYMASKADVSPYDPNRPPDANQFILVSLDHVWRADEQNPLLRWRISLDRGRYEGWFGDVLLRDIAHEVPAEIRTVYSAPMVQTLLVRTIPERLDFSFLGSEYMDVTGNGDLTLATMTHELGIFTLSRAELLWKTAQSLAGEKSKGGTFSLHQVTIR